MEVKLTAAGGFIYMRHLNELIKLGFQLQKEFTNEPGKRKDHWVTVNTPRTELDSDTLIEISRAVASPLYVDGRTNPPTVTILNTQI
jgi:hypothetical protein